MSFVLRPGLRAAAPLRQQLRSYATEPPVTGASSASPSSPGPKSGRGRLFWILVGGGVSFFTYTSARTYMKVQEFRRENPELVAQIQAAAEAKRGEAGSPADKTRGRGPLNDNNNKKALVGGDQGFVSLVLEAVEKVNHNTKRFRFRLPGDDMVSGVEVASAVLTRCKPVDADKPVVRPYTPISDEDAKGYMDLLVKKYPNGPMSTYMHDMAPGQRLDIKGPIPKYPWAANKHEHVALVAGGTGITPMWQLCRAIFGNPDDRTKVTLVFGNVTEEDILLKKELAELENTYPQRFRAFYVLDKPPAGWTGGASGFITQDLLKTVLPEPKEGGSLKIFVCGPPGMMGAVSGPKVSPKDQGELSGILKELGYSKDQVYKF